ncbi:MAG: hypothetical protein ACFBRM_05965 [Pikeienuella sp.]
MTLLTARLLMPLRDRRDWGQMHLPYLSEALYGPVMSLAHYDGPLRAEIVRR